MNAIKVKPYQDRKERGVKMTIKLESEGLPGIARAKYSEREVELVTKAFTQGRCTKESLGNYLKRIGAE